jgi:hypothetical protein
VLLKNFNLALKNTTSRNHLLYFLVKTIVIKFGPGVDQVEGRVPGYTSQLENIKKNI